MSNANSEQANKQFESLFLSPARAYASLAIDYTEQLMNTQYDAAKTYAEVGLNQFRSALSISDQEGLRNYVEGQQQVAKDVSERLQRDTQKVVSLNQEFMQKSQKLAEDNMKSASKSTAKATK
ncbi:phasin family protein [Litchfieldella xinjiangensis]|uniref:phasin family protein n=1 Tax=Litchfieldella xinjiangensis TaxID=1166948 RepID=UPI0005BBE013|nr:phasin family protein [Halomonas xinjiangensis]